MLAQVMWYDRIHECGIGVYVLVYIYIYITTHTHTNMHTKNNDTMISVPEMATSKHESVSRTMAYQNKKKKTTTTKKTHKKRHVPQ